MFFLQGKVPMRTGLVLLLFGIFAITSAAEPVEEPELTPKDREHWSFKPPVRPKTPAVSDSAWVRNPIDAFILARLDKAGLKPSPAADRATLLRRVTFDLTGLPPTPRELDDFLNDKHPDAYARVVERLLASPHYGERWGQHWLDVVRFAETNGYEGDQERPHAWRYRDYVVQSFNEDKPYNRFLTEQLAGDLLAKTARTDSSAPPSQEQAEWLIAAGFNRCGPIHLVGGNVDPAEPRQELLTEMTTSVGVAFLGLTMHCARCHDHKFDPISQADYYRLQAFFAGAQMKEVNLASAAERTEYERQLQLLNEKKINPLQKQLSNLEAPYKQRIKEQKTAKLEAHYRDVLALDAKKRTKEQTKLFNEAQTLLKVTWDEVVAELTPSDRAARAEWRRQLIELEPQKPPPLAQAWTLSDNGAKPALPLLLNGDLKKKGPLVLSAFPRVLVDPTAKSETHEEGLSRIDLAKWLTRPEHPLTGRVIVNRLWQHHFGRGLVATPNDFGLRGEKPTHPELLDWLACELVDPSPQPLSTQGRGVGVRGWSLKHLHRLMVLSNTYQQASRPVSEQAKKLDPNNRLLSRMNRQRLSAESLRDSALAVAGTLNPQVGGPMIRVPLEPEVYDLIFTESEPDGLWLVTPDVRQHTRRTLYLFAKRNVRLPLLEAFDQPDTLFSCPVRPVSTFAPQALILLNGPLMQKQSKAFAGRVLSEGGKERAAQIERAYRLALARPPREVERKQALEFLERQTELVRDRLLARLPVALPPKLSAEVDPAYAAALVDFCLALLNCNEFLYVN
jgi:Protein of unknown function (DUF1549)/Protein of unknown function (DUF1553)